MRSPSVEALRATMVHCYWRIRDYRYCVETGGAERCGLGRWIYQRAAQLKSTLWSMSVLVLQMKGVGAPLTWSRPSNLLGGRGQHLLHGERSNPQHVHRFIRLKCIGSRQGTWGGRLVERSEQAQALAGIDLALFL